MHSDVKFTNALAVNSFEGSGSYAYSSSVLDTANFSKNMFVLIVTGGIGDEYVISFQESNTAPDESTGNIDGTDVLDSNLVGAENWTSYELLESDVVHHAEYLGSKRYVQVQINPTTASVGSNLCGLWMQSGGRLLPDPDSQDQIEVE